MLVIFVPQRSVQLLGSVIFVSQQMKCQNRKLYSSATEDTHFGTEFPEKQESTNISPLTQPAREIVQHL